MSRTIDADHLKRWIISRGLKSQLHPADIIDQIDRESTIEPRCEACEAFNKTRLLISQPQQRWIPCSKELPERNLVVLVTTRWGEVTEGVKLTGNAWFIGRGEDNAFDSDILAWMPKPEPYKESKKCDTCKHEKEPWSMQCHRCENYNLWEEKQ